jgi:hypothetical protein
MTAVFRCASVRLSKTARALLVWYWKRLFDE